MGTGGATDRGTQQLGAVGTGVSCFLSRRADFGTSLHFNRGNYCNRFPFVFPRFFTLCLPSSLLSQPLQMLVRHHIDSFNFMLEEGLSYAVQVKLDPAL